MKALKSQINLRIVNNTSFNQFVDILSVIPNPLSANESNGLYNLVLNWHCVRNDYWHYANGWSYYWVVDSIWT